MACKINDNNNGNMLERDAGQWSLTFEQDPKGESILDV